MPSGISPFGAALPYWTTLYVATREKSHLVGGGVPVLLLKDGTLAVGLRTSGIDVYAAGNALLNRHAAILTKALSSLPAKAYVQASFETGLRFDGLIEQFAQQSQEGSLPLLKWGRAERARKFAACEYLTRCQITYWIGWRGALQDLSPKKGLWAVACRTLGLGQGPQVERVRTAAEVLYGVAVGFRDIAGQMNLPLEFLSEPEMLSDCHRAINPTMHMRFAPPMYVETPDDLAAYRRGEPLLMRGPSLSSQLALAPCKWTDTKLVIGEPPILLQALGVSRLPQATRPDSLHGLMYADMPLRPFRLSVTHEATNYETSRDALVLKRRLASSLMGRVLVNHAAQAAFADLDDLIAAVAHGARLFNTHVVAVVSGHTEKELREASQAVRRGAQDKGIACVTLVDEQLPGWQGSLPANGYMAPKTATLVGENCAHLLPYWLPSTGETVPEIVLENRQRGLDCLTVRPGPVREHAGAAVIGALGTGKTFLMTHLMKYGVLDRGGHVVLVDNKGPEHSSYRRLCELLQGTYIALENNEKVAFNPLPTRAEVELAEKMAQEIAQEKGEDSAESTKDDVLDPLVRIVCMMSVPDFETAPNKDHWRMIAREVVNLTYEAPAPDPARPLTLSDVLAAFDRYEPSAENFRGLAATMKENLFVWLQDPRRARLFNRPQHADMSNPFTVFDFYGMDKDPEASAVLISILASRIELKLTTLPRPTPKLFGFDEAWQMFATPQACALLNRLYRIVRTYGGFCYVLSQNFNDVDKSPARDGILSNTSLIYLMKHLQDHQAVAENLKLSPRELELFESLEVQPGQYAECLVIDRHESRTHVVQYWATPFDVWCDTSRPADVHMRDQLVQKMQRPLEEVVLHLAKTYPHGAPNATAPSPQEVSL